MDNVVTKPHTDVLPLVRIRKMRKVAPGDTALSIDAGTSISFSARFIDVKDTQKYIIWDEAQGYMRFGFDYFKGKFQIPKMPPLCEIMRPFLRSVFLWPSSRRASWHKVAQRSGTLETIDLRLNGPGPGP